MHSTTAIIAVAWLSTLATSSPMLLEKRSTATTSMQMTASVTTSSTTACPTTPEQGTYCGFINPEDPCAPQPGGHGPKMVPDTVSVFQTYKPFHGMASNATTPPTYTNVFKNLTAAAEEANYVGLYLLESYDTMACAAKCNEVAGCNSFNVYVERDPTQAPSKNDSTAPTVWGRWCPNPESMTNYKCALWAIGINAPSAVNNGEMREDFQVVISGSNGYVKSTYMNSTTYQTPHLSSSSNPTATYTGYSIPVYTGAGSRAAPALLSAWGMGLLGLSVFMMMSL